MAAVSRAQADDESGKPPMRLPISSGNVPTTISSQSNENVNITGCDDEDRSSAAEDLTVQIMVSEEDGYALNDIRESATGTSTYLHSVTNGTDKGHRVGPATKKLCDDILAKSRHRDGSIYSDVDLLWWKKEYRIADRNESRLEAMSLSDPTDCVVRDGTCMTHDPFSMLQFYSVELAEIPVDGGLVELYGYIAVRDDIDSLLNYVINISRDDPIVVEEGSLINMTGPKRGIDMADSVLIEHDMRIKAGEEEKDDIQLIDGASLIAHEGKWDQPFTFRIPGDGGAVDIILSCLLYAVEATVEVLISEVQSSFNLSVGCLSSGFNEEIRLFDGAVAESCSLKRSVVAVLKNSSIDLKFKVAALSSSSDHQHCCSFKAKTHGHDNQEIKNDFVIISVKLTWSTLPGSFSG
ncbi:uncharacterized protein [Triticum aestivum]|uniref:uncharacterized protein n=1 Tax=Triticum aestivum TaxID=4565 RepID=UPI001D02DC7B|nr:uncharacterized protein LOC123157625 [Triticum aestivum]